MTTFLEKKQTKESEVERKRKSETQGETTPAKRARSSLSRRAKTRSGYGNSGESGSESAVSMAIRAATGQQSSGDVGGVNSGKQKVTCGKVLLRL